MAAGAGMIRLGNPGNPSAAWPTEAVRMRLDGPRWAAAFLSATEKCRAVVIGPGLGTDAATQEEIRTVIAGVPRTRWSIDADAITALGDAPAARELLAQRRDPTVLTPHDGEYAAAGRRRRRATTAWPRPATWPAGSVPSCCSRAPSPRWPRPAAGSPDVLLASAGVPALATAGTGDVLSGVIGAFLARGVPAHLAAALGAHVHGSAAARGRPEGLVAGDLPDLIAALAQRATATMADGLFKLFRAGMKGPTVRCPSSADAERGGDGMAQGRSRPAWAEIDLAAITHNARVLSQLVRPAQLCAVVKAHGYGHGAPAVAKAALAGGAIGLAVALVDEGVELRRHGVRGPVLLLSECGADAVDAAMAYSLTPRSTPPTASSCSRRRPAAGAAQLRSTSRWTPACTGSVRPPARCRRSCGPSLDDPLLRFEGLWTHLAVADGESAEDRAFTQRQLDVVRRRAGRPRSERHALPDVWCTPPTRPGRSPFPRRATAWSAAASGSTATSPARR